MEHYYDGDYDNPNSQDYINPELKAYLDELKRKQDELLKPKPATK